MCFTKRVHVVVYLFTQWQVACRSCAEEEAYKAHKIPGCPKRPLLHLIRQELKENKRRRGSE